MSYRDEGYYPPVDEELIACKKLYRLSKKVDKIEDDLENLASGFSGANFSWGIEADFILTGVRTNGREFPHTIAAYMLYTESMKKAWPETKEKIAVQLSKFDNVLLRVKELCQDLELCDKCHGECGESIRRAPHMSVHDWFDCDACNGRGVKPKSTE